MNPLTITSASLSSTNPNGVLVDRHDPGDGGRDGDDHGHGDRRRRHHGDRIVHGHGRAPTAGRPTPTINFRPFASPVSATAQEAPGTQITLAGTSGYPDTTMPSTLSYSLVSQPAHGTITNFDASTGTFTYTPDKNYLGTDSFQYEVNATGPADDPGDHDQQPGHRHDHGRGRQHRGGVADRPRPGDPAAAQAARRDQLRSS